MKSIEIDGSKYFIDFEKAKALGIITDVNLEYKKGRILVALTSMFYYFSGLEYLTEGKNYEILEDAYDDSDTVRIAINNGTIISAPKSLFKFLGH